MVVIIRYADGSYAEGVIRRLDGARLRAAVAGLEDAVDYRLIHGQWTSEKGAVVSFEFSFEPNSDCLRIIRAGDCGKSPECAAGGDCAIRRMSSGDTGPVN